MIHYIFDHGNLEQFKTSLKAALIVGTPENKKTEPCMPLDENKKTKPCMPLDGTQLGPRWTRRT